MLSHIQRWSKLAVINPLFSHWIYLFSYCTHMCGFIIWKEPSPVPRPSQLSSFWPLTVQLLTAYSPAFDRLQSSFWPPTVQLLTAYSPAFDRLQSSFWPPTVQLLSAYSSAFDRLQFSFWPLTVQLLTAYSPAFDCLQSSFWALTVRKNWRENAWETWTMGPHVIYVVGRWIWGGRRP